MYANSFTRAVWILFINRIPYCLLCITWWGFFFKHSYLHALHTLTFDNLALALRQGTTSFFDFADAEKNLRMTRVLGSWETGRFQLHTDDVDFEYGGGGEGGRSTARPSTYPTFLFLKLRGFKLAS